MKIESIYFKKPGKENTGETLRIVKNHAEKLNIQTILIATNSGETAFMALDFMPERTIIAVTHSTGFSKENEQEMAPENRRQIESRGGKVLTCQHAFAGISRAVRFKFNTYEVDEIVANTLRLFGQGTKVAVEIVLMAADAGLIRTDEDVISVGGTGRGADTAAVIKPDNVSRFFDLKIRAVLCKPSNF